MRLSRRYRLLAASLKLSYEPLASFHAELRYGNIDI